MAEKKIILVFGKRGSGKSYLVKKLVQKEQRLLINDTMSEYSQGVIFEAEDLDRFLIFWGEHYRRPYRLIYRPLKPKEEIEQLAELVYAIGNITFVCEEIDLACTPYEISDSLAYVIQRGRHKNITLIGITQRPYGIHRLLTSQAKEIYIFSTNEPRDREYLRTLLGQEIEAKLDSLKQYQYVKWQDGKQDLEVGKA